MKLRINNIIGNISDIDICHYEEPFEERFKHIDDIRFIDDKNLLCNETKVEYDMSGVERKDVKKIKNYYRNIDYYDIVVKKYGNNLFIDNLLERYIGKHIKYIKIPNKKLITYEHIIDNAWKENRHGKLITSDGNELSFTDIGVYIDKNNIIKYNKPKKYKKRKQNSSLNNIDRKITAIEGKLYELSRSEFYKFTKTGVEAVMKTDKRIESEKVKINELKEELSILQDKRFYLLFPKHIAEEKENNNYYNRKQNKTIVNKSKPKQTFIHKQNKKKEIVKPKCLLKQTMFNRLTGL